jgi:cytochrome c biogenesis protein CcmG/thiol:disulfide interchange protein DsbE
VYCIGEYPLLEEAYEEESAKVDGVVMFALNIRQSSQALEEFNRINGYTLPILMDPGAYTAHAYGISGIPATFFIDREGIIRSVRYGAISGLKDFQTQTAKITGN